ncbi:hypothetical protein BDV93DRAFT_526161 [Ceratobasidium sp. AG-I]|nr:hypothetical protein BDV93DRAFT_526161 [Ceratobasidium sp. AG-I]
MSNFSMSPPVSISGIESAASDIESTSAVREARNSNTPTPVEGIPSKLLKANKDLVLETLDIAEDFDFSDGDTCILSGDTLVATHRYLLKRFKNLRDRISDGTLVLGSEDPCIEDFRNTLRILYASVIEERSDFDPPTLTSALRLATTYEYPALRTFAIKRLQDASLTAVERIQLAREFGLSSWEEPAYIELCERDEAITTSEASVLGLNAFVELARIREKEQRRRGRDIDSMIEGDDDESLTEDLHVPEGDLEAVEPAPQPTTAASPTKSKKKRVRRPTKSTPIGVAKATNGQAKPQAIQDREAKVKEDEGKCIEASIKPCFIDVATPETHDRSHRKSTTGMIELSGDDCTCRFEPGQWWTGRELVYGEEPCRCKLPACAVRAFKGLQTQQVAHTNSIAHLESVITQLQTPPAPPPESPTKSASPELTASKSIHEEVRSWLDRCRVQVECE